MITDKLSNSKANPSIRSTGMSLPKWDGQFKNFYSWRLQFELYLKSATIDKDEDQLMFLLHTPVLPPRVTSSIQSCTTMIGPNGVWDRLEEKIPKSAVIKEIISEMEAIRPIRQKTAALETRAVLDRLSDFARRITEVGKESELYSPTVVRTVLADRGQNCTRRPWSELYSPTVVRTVLADHGPNCQQQAGA